VWHAVVRRRFPDVRSISIDELRARMGSVRPPVLLDARTREEFDVSHLEGAVPAPDRDAALEALAGEPPDREIVVYCSVGWRSARLAEELAARGFGRVRNLEGAIFRWANRGLPLHRNGERATRVHPFDATWGLLLEPERRAPLPRARS
jgi:rhodanese-related sulfurtransferase